MSIKIALAGVGGYGTFYLQELLNSNSNHEFELVAGIDPFPDRSSMYMELKQANIPIFPDLSAFYKNETADLVILAAPIHLHAPLTCLALSHGSNVLCEKPLGASAEDAMKMMEAEVESGKLISIGYQWSFSDAILSLKRDIIAGRLGKPLRFRSLVLWPRSQSYYQHNDWAGHIRSTDGSWVLDSPVNNATAHYLHNSLFLLGKSLSESAVPTQILSELNRANPIENYDTAALRVNNDADVDLLFLTAHSVISQHGPLIHYEFEDAIVEYSDTDPEFKVYFRNGIVESYGSPDATIYNKLWQTIDSIHTSTPVVCGVQTAIPQLMCVLGAQKTPIVSFPPELVKVYQDGNDSITWVEGLAEVFMACYQSNTLPSENKKASWAVKTDVVNLHEYAYLLTGLTTRGRN